MANPEKTSLPFFLKSPIQDNPTADRTEPADWPAWRIPNPCGPTFNISVAKIGIRVVAEEKKLLKKSRKDMERITGDLRRKCRPSAIAEKLTRAAPKFFCVGLFILTMAARTARKETILIK